MRPDLSLLLNQRQVSDQLRGITRRILALAGSPPKWTKDQQAKFEIRMEDTGPATILIHGYIGSDWWDESSTSEQSFRNALKNIPTDRELIVSINSEGGSVKEGLGIYDAIRRWQGKTTARIAGCAFSIASVIPLACDSVISPRACFWMIHDPHSRTEGNSEDHRKSIEMLEACAETMAAVYSEATGKTRKQMREAMKAETWLTGEQALAWGLADEATDDEVDFEASRIIENFHPPERMVAMMRNRAKPPNTKTNPPPTAAGQPADTMQKANILALLKKHGKTLEDSATDEQILAALEEAVSNGKITKAEAEALKHEPAPVYIQQDKLQQMQADLAREKRARITQEFRNLAADRQHLRKSEDEWVDRLVKDESLFALLRAMPIFIPPGTDPVHQQPARDLGNSFVEAYRKLKAGAARMAFAADNWLGLREAFESVRIHNMASLSIEERLRRLESPRATNTYSATLVTDRLADGVITTLGYRLASLRSFSREFSTDRLKPRATVQVRKVTVGSTVQTNPTNFETGGSTTVPVSVAVDQLNVNFSSTNDELNKGHAVAQVAEKNAQNFANKVSDAWCAVLQVADYGAAYSIGDSGTFDGSDMPGILALAKNYGRKNLILDGSYRAGLAPIDLFKFPLGAEGAFGFDLITEQNKWTGAATNTVGLVCDPNAIAVCSGLPLELPPQEYLELQTFTIEGLDLSCLLAHWFSKTSREHWMSLDVMFGAKAGDTTAARILSS